MRFIQQYVVYGNETDHARCPYLTRLSDRRLIIGMNILHNDTKLSYDWDRRQKPHYIIGNGVEDLVRRQPTLLSDKQGLPPMFFECRDGSILAAYNSWREYELGSQEADAALRDDRLKPFLRARYMHKTERQAVTDKRIETDQQREELLGWTPEAGSRDALGLLQPITILRSTDGGWSWSPWSAVYHDNERRVGGAGFRGNMLQFDDGEILFMNSAFANGDDGNDARLMHSTDGGRNWNIKSTLRIADHPGDRITESHIYAHPDGRISVISRTTVSSNLAIAHSDDKGRTWTQGPRLTNVWGYPAHVLPHSSGKAILTYYRRGVDPKGLCAKVLEPDLSDMESAEEHMLHLQVGEGIGNGGYPSAIEDDDGTVLVAYFDRLRPYGPTNILIRRFEMQPHPQIVERSAARRASG